MTDSDTSFAESEVDNFWQLSTAFYESAMVSEYLLELQKSQQRNVNELLFGLWTSHFYRARLTPAIVKRVRAAAKRTKSWVNNIRSTRLDLEQQWQAPYPEQIQSARDAMLATEIKIERLHQQKMVEGLVSALATHELAASENDEALLLDNLTLSGGEVANESDYLQLIMLWQGFIESNQ